MIYQFNNLIFCFSLSFQREINEVFEQRKLNESSMSAHQHENKHDDSEPNDDGYEIRTAKIPNLHREHRVDDKKQSMEDYGGICSVKRARTKQIIPSDFYTSEMKKTNDWANSILKELDILMLANKGNSVSIDGDGDECSRRLTTSLVASMPSVDLSKARIVSSPLPTSPLSPVSPLQKRSTIINVTLRKATPAIKTTTTRVNNHDSNSFTAHIDRNHILKPEKHVSNTIRAAIHVHCVAVLIEHKVSSTFGFCKLSNADVQNPWERDVHK